MWWWIKQVGQIFLLMLGSLVAVYLIAWGIYNTAHGG